MKICLYVPCRNGEATLPEVFEAVRCQTLAPQLLLLVNDQSSDATAALAEAAGWTVVHTTPERSGLAAARNIAAGIALDAGCDVLAGLDADAVPAPRYTAELDAFFANHPQVAATCGNMRERYTKDVSDLWRSVYMRQHWGDQPLDNPPILYGSSAAHRLDVLRAVGGYNESLRTNFEDTELTQRLLRAGHRLAYVPTAYSEHLKRDTPDSVLGMFWNWYRPPADLAGHFADVNAWLQHRLPWLWNDYAVRVIRDAATPRLSAITTALPWSQLLRDLHLLAERAGMTIDLRPVVDMAADIHDRHGFGADFTRWLRVRLHVVLEECGAGGAPLHPEVISRIRDAATRVVPRKGYWEDIANSVTQLGLAPVAGD